MKILFLRNLTRTHKKDGKATLEDDVILQKLTQAKLKAKEERRIVVPAKEEELAASEASLVIIERKVSLSFLLESSGLL